MAKSIQDYSFSTRPIGNDKVKLGEELSLIDLEPEKKTLKKLIKNAYKENKLARNISAVLYK